ncbi:MAG TPA: M23 family metallopeptidase, partial [Candidatus Deferrimicrobium sp.]|nr:M23 family metallopeptidase [Candidatus Deferrimicrobium sp.]
MKVSTRIRWLLVMVVGMAGVSRAEMDWPLREDIDLSSGFGDYRPGHFHFGVDLRTGGTIGKSLYSPIDGYVMRVRTSYIGYGKSLYIRGDDSFIYVFGHLADFNGPIDQIVKTAQQATRRYAQDLELPRDSVRVKRGEFIAYSGQTGAGPPHVQFEVRTTENVPINPLINGFELPDTVKPVFERIGFQLLDERSLFDDGTRKMFLDVTRVGKSGQYRLDTVLYFHQPFGILVDCYDRMRSSGMKQAVHRLSLFIDDRPFYEVVFDSLDFSTTKTVGLEYDYFEAADGREEVRTLFKKDGNAFKGSRASGSHRGVFGLSGAERIGWHQARVVAEDCFGNSVQLDFEFVWGPAGDIYRVDSTVSVAADTTLFYFSPSIDPKSLGIDSVRVFLSRGQMWGPVISAIVTQLGDGKLSFRLKGYQIETAVLRLFMFGRRGCLIRDNIFNGLLKKGTAKFAVKHEIVEDGLLITLESTGKNAAQSRLDLYHGDSLLGTEYPTCLSIARFACLIPPLPQYRRVDRLVAVMSLDTAYRSVVSDSVNLYVVGLEEKEKFEVGKHLTVQIGRNRVYRPQFVEIGEHTLMTRSRLGLNSPYYKVSPNAFICREDFDLTLRLPYGHPSDDRSGLCWLDEQADHWVWLRDSRFSDGVVTASASGGGIYAAVMDNELPRLKYLSVGDQRRYQNRRLAVNFVIEDTLSGIG